LTPAVPAPAKFPVPAVPIVPHAGLVDVVVDVVVGEAVGIGDTDRPSTRVLAMGNGFGSGTAGAELTPRLPIS
jgi:hypothetical protein